MVTCKKIYIEAQFARVTESNLTPYVFFIFPSVSGVHRKLVLDEMPQYVGMIHSETRSLYKETLNEKSHTI